jgi:transmembrane sensor
VEHSELRNLFAKYMEGILSPSEYEQLSEAAQTFPIDDWQEALTPLIENISTVETFDEQEWKDIVENILRQPRRKPTRTVTMKWWLRRIAVAASVILIIGTGIYIAINLFNNKQETEIVETQEKRFKNDVQPGKSGAILTLDNGQQVILDSLQNGMLAEQGNSNIIKQGDRLSYNQQQTTKEVVYNTITTPRGRQYPNLVLADGSRVWLDAASSIRFPTSFTGRERVVEITGQVWFDVIHNAKVPFKVIANGIEINDLGTEFNVNAYDDEEVVKTTLIAGLIKVGKNDKSVTMQPGQQAIFQNDNLSLNKNVNLDEVMAWKTGYFQSDNVTVESVMRQLARWYDVDIVYEKHITKRVSLLGVPRTITMVNILKIMEATGNVKFKIDGRTVTVMP